MSRTLLEMLTYARPAGSPADRAFRARYLLNLPGAIEDRHGNIHVLVGDPIVLWSCHTDTVHRASGRQTIAWSGSLVYLPDASPSNCLGADDTVGAYLAREMVLAGVPGAYVFHFGEEHGGIGSRGLARTDPDYVRQFTIAIALDRQGTGDIVTYQHGRRCCSETFAASLATELARVGPGLEYGPVHGVYTDTAEYVDLIGECTNVSVGYAGQHGRAEYVDLDHVDRLRSALLAIDVSRLTVSRKPGEDDREDWPAWDAWIDEDDDPIGPVDPDPVTGVDAYMAWARRKRYWDWH